MKVNSAGPPWAGREKSTRGTGAYLASKLRSAASRSYLTSKLSANRIPTGGAK